MSIISAMGIFRIGASTMMAQERVLDTISNNIANVGTPGFSRSRVEFKEIIGEVAASGDAAGVAIAGTRRLWQQGTLRPTGRSLDLAIEGEGFFQTQLPDGRLGYTRNGSLQRSADGRIVTNEGHPLVPNLVIPDNVEDYRFSNDGGLQVRLAGQMNWQQIGALQLARFPNNEGLEQVGGGVFVPTVASGEPQLGAPGQGLNGKLIPETLEDSSVDLAEEMVDLMMSQRIYALGLRIVQTADEMQSLANQVVGR